MARRFGPPTWFITMTTNPEWPEIKQELGPGQVWADRPDVVVRVFQDRKRHLMSDLVNKQLFGKVKAWFLSDEFQKSSLPHVHILLFMEEEDKPKSAEDVDRIITAEIPDRNHPVYDLVVKQMMHHACDKWRRAKPPACKPDGKKCRFRFPQQFAEQTDIDKRYVQYRRKQDGKTVKCKTTGQPLDNRNCVPRNDYLCIRCNTHVCCCYIKTTVEAFKDLCIYMNKNPDRTYVSLTDKNRNNATTKFYEWDETEHYRECRYINAAEAVYIIKSHDLGQSSHSVMVLPFHLEGEQNVFFVEGEEEDAVSKDNASQLVKWFELNKNAELAELNNEPLNNDPRNVLYVDMPAHYVWNKKNKMWTPRLKDPALGRLGIIVPNQNNLELFYLRMLLMNIPGATSFQDLKTVQGIEQDSYFDACKLHGLAKDNLLPNQIISELATIMTPSCLRYNFAMVLKWCLPERPDLLWEQFKDALSDDLQPRGEYPSEVHHNIALAMIKNILQSLDIDFNATGLPEVKEDLCAEYKPPDNDFSCSSKDLTTAEGHLKPQQRYLYHKIVNKILGYSTGANNMLLVLGAGGVGKTFLYDTIIMYCKVNNINFSACAYTGIAATLLHCGQTAHKLFGIPIKEDDAAIFLSTIKCESEQAQKLISTQVIIWDEISLVNRWQIELVDKYLRLLCKIDAPFANKIVILSGDFRQILPVVRHGYRQKTVEASIINTILWHQIEIVEMNENIRAENNPEFARWLLSVGDGSANHKGTSRLDFPKSMLKTTLPSLIDSTFPDGPGNSTGSEVILTPLNRDMREINEFVAEQLPGVARTYLSCNEFEPDGTWDDNKIPITSDVLGTTDAANLPPHRLKLKEGAIVMLLCNLDISKGLCNGARFRVLKCMDYTIKCERLGGPDDLRNEPVYLFKVIISKDDTGLPGVIKRQQFPIRLAYCVTVNKSQGSTNNRVGILLPSPCFSHGQLYVALSRAKQQKNVHILVRRGSEQGYTEKRGEKHNVAFTRNEVYQEVLRSVSKHDNYLRLSNALLK
ncbi:ATP-dependent DNA helicase [Frankliniella fusca]|uniref:ATP-dependent DNA helicase n=1 Tax=Frankliniella fusca TaxID=407009 RepID=A0AAE1LVN6_9NEOP|nr:ATP-dependent DNA helicase [Frankliniella fusca]